jgi:hypothetical protein
MQVTVTKALMLLRDHSHKHNQHQITKLGLKAALGKILVPMMIPVGLVKELSRQLVLVLDNMMTQQVVLVPMSIRPQMMMLDHHMVVPVKQKMMR